MDNNSKYPRIISIIILITISLVFLILALWPTISVLLMSPQEQASIEISGLFILALQAIMPFPCFLLALGLYKLLEKFLKLYILSRRLIAVLSFLIIMPAILSFPAIYAANRIGVVITSNAVNVSLLSEQINKVQNTIGDPKYPGANPNLYEYQYELKIGNRADRTYATHTRISLGWDAPDKLWKWDMISLDSSNWQNITLQHGENVISGKFPIVFYDISGKTPRSAPVQLEVYIKKIDGADAFKSFKLNSSLDWIKIYEEQQEFWNKNTRK